MTGVLGASSISVIIPAFNEADYIPDTLDRLAEAGRHFMALVDGAIQIIVVDNASTDRTAELAESAGTTVIHEPVHNIARARNAGAAVASHDVLVFLDADTLVPPGLLLRINQVMADPMCVGGAVDFFHQADRLLIQAYLKFWRVLGLLGGMAQGACQFCRRRTFHELRGYDESWYMGEDVDFYWRLRRLARQQGRRTFYIRDLQLKSSPRRWDRWPLWRIFIWTSPLVTFACRHRRSAWGGWYRKPPR
jgi:glycosyltransferase involved in cell wall biosynthesis